MAYKFMVGGLEVTCDTLEDLRAAHGEVQIVAETDEVSFASLTVAKEGLVAAKAAWDAAKVAFTQAEDALVKAKLAVTQAKIALAKPTSKGTQGRGPQKAWAEAEEYALKHNLTKFEARAILKTKKTAAVNAAMKTLAEGA